MSSDNLDVRRGEILPAIPPRFAEAGVELVTRDGYRTLRFPPELRDHYNVINPVVELSQASPDWMPMIREIRLNVEMDAYGGASHHKSDECSLNKIGLYKLAEAAKIEIETRRIPARDLGPTERVGWTALAAQRHSDGTLTKFESSSSFDNEAERMKIEAQVAKGPLSTAEKARKVESQWLTKIQKASELCETLAIERAIRGVLKVPHKFKKADLQKSFAVICYGFDPNSPEARAAAQQGMAALYGVSAGDSPRQLLPPPDTSADVVVDVVVEEAGVVVEEGGGDGVAAPEPPPAEPEPEAEPEPVKDENAALFAKARAAKIPNGSYQGRPLSKVTDLRWLRWARKQEWPSERFGEFGALLEAYCRADVPAALETEKEKEEENA